MQTQNEPISLVNIAKGAAIKEFDAAFAKVLKDIQDPNTLQKVRTITTKTKIMPNKAGNFISVEVSNDVKLAGKNPISTGAIIGTDENGFLYAEEVKQQEQLPLPEGSKVIKISKE